MRLLSELATIVTPETLAPMASEAHRTIQNGRRPHANYLAGSYFDRTWNTRITELLRDLNRPIMRAERVALKVDGETIFVDPAEIRWVESAGNHVTVHSHGNHSLTRDTLTNMAGRLEPLGFVRISRSSLVNIARIAAVKPCGFGEYSVRLDDTTQLTLSRCYREAFFGSVERL